MKKTIVINVTPEGEVKIETRGFKGQACLEEANFLKDLLGRETARQLTPAYYHNRGRKIIKKHLPLCG